WGGIRCMHIGMGIYPDDSKLGFGVGHLKACDGAACIAMVTGEQDREYAGIDTVFDALCNSFPHFKYTLDSSGMGRFYRFIQQIIFILELLPGNIDKKTGHKVQCRYLNGFYSQTCSPCACSYL